MVCKRKFASAAKLLLKRALSWSLFIKSTEDSVDLKLQSFQMDFGLKIELIGWDKVFIIGFDKTSNGF